MHECPQCGQACDCDGEDVWHDYPYNLNCTHECEDEDEDEGSFSLDACVDCGSVEIGTTCQCCGGWLCHRHAETGAGFCKTCPTKGWIEEQEAELRK